MNEQQEALFDALKNDDEERDAILEDMILDSTPENTKKAYDILIAGGHGVQIIIALGGNEE